MSQQITTSQKPLTTAVIVTYKSINEIGEALDNLRPCYDAGLLECIVVDNASDDGTPEFIQEHHGWVTLIESGANIGFGRGNNLGIERATTPYVLLLNPDAQIVPGELAKLHDFMESHPKAGIISPATEFTGGGYQPIRTLPSPTQLVAEAGRLSSAEKRKRDVVLGEEPFQTNWICGAIMHCRRELLNQLNGFDESFFLYFEETDLCVRAQQLGYELWLVATAHSLHEGGASAESSGEETFGDCVASHYFQSRYYYLCKHHGKFAATLTEWGEVACLGFWDLLRLCLGKPSKQFRKRIKLPIASLPSPPIPTSPIIHAPNHQTEATDTSSQLELAN